MVGFHVSGSCNGEQGHQVSLQPGSDTEMSKVTADVRWLTFRLKNGQSINPGSAEGRMGHRLGNRPLRGAPRAYRRVGPGVCPVCAGQPGLTAARGNAHARIPDELGLHLHDGHAGRLIGAVIVALTWSAPGPWMPIGPRASCSTLRVRPRPRRLNAPCHQSSPFRQVLDAMRCGTRWTQRCTAFKASTTCAPEKPQ